MTVFQGISSSALWMSVTVNHSPSNGFINASLAIVAEAPLSAIQSPFVSHAYPGLTQEPVHLPAASG
jgi:hypothetical protein